MPIENLFYKSSSEDSTVFFWLRCFGSLSIVAYYSCSNWPLVTYGRNFWYLDRGVAGSDDDGENEDEDG